MSTKSKIEWTETTWPDRTVIRFTEKTGRNRTRVYERKRTDRPGVQERRKQRAAGLAWCRGCGDWLPVGEVSRGACRPHTNAEYRANYAADGRAIRARANARKRRIAPLPVEAAELLTEEFGGICAYCPEPADAWDHLVPVASGGDTVPANVVPACSSCNSSKRSSELLNWLDRTGRIPNSALWDVLALDYVTRWNDDEDEN